MMKTKSYKNLLISGFLFASFLFLTSIFIEENFRKGLLELFLGASEERIVLIMPYKLFLLLRIRELATFFFYTLGFLFFSIPSAYLLYDYIKNDLFNFEKRTWEKLVKNVNKEVEAYQFWVYVLPDRLEKEPNMKELSKAYDTVIRTRLMFLLKEIEAFNKSDENLKEKFYKYAPSVALLLRELEKIPKPPFKERESN